MIDRAALLVSWSGHMLAVRSSLPLVVAALLWVSGLAVSQVDVRPGVGKKESAVEPSALAVQVPPHGKCKFQVAVQPERLMPGQSGRARIIMVLQEDSVMEAPATLSITLAERRDGQPPSKLSIETAFVHPPQMSTVAEGYRGRLVYDNVAVIDLPVVMSAEATLGSRPSVDVLCDFTLHRGATGKLFGTYSNSITISCEVGDASTPAVQPASVRNAPRASRPPSSDQQSRDPAQRTATSRESLSGSVATSAAGGTQETRATPGDRPGLGATETSSGLLLWVVGVGCVIAVLLVIAQVRKR